MCLGPRKFHALKYTSQKCAYRRFSMDLREQVYDAQCNEKSIVQFSAKLEYFFFHRVWYLHASCHLMPEVSRLNGTNVELCTWNISTNSIPPGRFCQMIQTFADRRSIRSYNLGVCSNSRVARKAEASYTQVNSMLLLCGAFKHIIMFTKAYPLRKQELTQICQMYSWRSINVLTYFHEHWSVLFCFVLRVIIPEVYQNKANIAIISEVRVS